MRAFKRAGKTPFESKLMSRLITLLAGCSIILIPGPCHGVELCIGGWIYARHALCRSSAHGQEYQSKRDPQCGVESVSVEMHRGPDCGVETYKICRDRAHGFEKWESAAPALTGRTDAPDKDVSRCGATIKNNADSLLKDKIYLRQVPPDTQVAFNVSGYFEKDTIGQVFYYCSFSVSFLRPVYYANRSGACEPETYNTCPRYLTYKQCALPSFGTIGNGALARSDACPYEAIWLYKPGAAPQLQFESEHVECATCDQIVVKSFLDWFDRLSCLGDRLQELSTALYNGTVVPAPTGGATGPDDARVTSPRAVEQVIRKEFLDLVNAGYQKDKDRGQALLLQLLDKAITEKKPFIAREIVRYFPPPIVEQVRHRLLPTVEQLDSALFVSIFRSDKQALKLSLSDRTELLQKLNTLRLEEVQSFRLADLWVGAELADINALSARSVKLRNLQLRAISSSQDTERIALATEMRSVLDKARKPGDVVVPEIPSDPAQLLLILEKTANAVEALVDERYGDVEKLVRDVVKNAALSAALHAQISLLRLDSTAFSTNITKALAYVPSFASPLELLAVAQESVSSAVAMVENVQRLLASYESSLDLRDSEIDAQVAKFLGSLEDSGQELLASQFSERFVILRNVDAEQRRDTLKEVFAAYLAILRNFESAAKPAASEARLAAAKEKVLWLYD
jgi:hypothetical protein